MAGMSWNVPAISGPKMSACLSDSPPPAPPCQVRTFLLEHQDHLSLPKPRTETDLAELQRLSQVGPLEELPNLREQVGRTAEAA